MSLRIEQVSTKQELKKFIRLPFQIHKDHERWVPPLFFEEWKYFDPGKNSAFQKNDTIRLMAYMDDKPVGRIMGIINRQRNTRLHEQNACFGYLECYNDPVPARALLQYIEKWASEKGMNKLVGPMGFSDQDPEGFLVEGFEFEPTLATYYNFEYIPLLLKRSGYSKEIDYVVYQIDLTNPVPVVYTKIVERLKARGQFDLPVFTRKKELKPHIKPVLQLMNESFAGLYGFDPLTDEEIDAIGKKFLPVIDPRFVRLAYQGDKLAAFILGIPNLNYGFRKAWGKLFPFGLLWLIRAPRKTRQFDLLMAGVHPYFRGSGLDAYGMTSIMEAARLAGYTIMDSHHELESNLAVRSEMERLGGRLCKRFRIYGKLLT
jgi:hypothetical protein